MNEDEEDGNTYSYPLYMIGQVSTMAEEDSTALITALRNTVFEITGKRVEDKPKQKMGFY